MLTDQDVRELVAGVLDVDAADVGSDRSFYVDLGMDSLHKAEFIVRLERACGAEFSPADAARMDSVGEVMRLLDDRRRVS
ncbi:MULTISPECIES: acyl carrier protein [Streptomyces]|uniref:acyl carrier protein n=1 Tax=Streptomyces TaxID=1883 RepID=UPI001CCA1F74|nr:MULTISPECIES: acyl carrier protein [Streptomyces]UBI36192.1 acyl carrier protein [Streptomyces mobaraensis]UKW28785.1 acyl carrier protein [Streptomyces sp. TYQ1024]